MKDTETVYWKHIFKPKFKLIWNELNSFLYASAAANTENRKHDLIIQPQSST